MLRIKQMAEEARPSVLIYSKIDDQIDALSDFIFYQMNFRGNQNDYHDPRNSYLNEVIDRRTGIPISLSLVWISIAQRLGIPAYGIGLPGHFIVGIYDQNGHSGYDTLIDPFYAGLRLTLSDCERLVSENTTKQGVFNPKWLNPISPVDLLARMLNNLCRDYIYKEDWQSAIPVLQHLLLIQPDTDHHLRDLGYVHLYAGSMRLSAQYLEEYLRRSPASADYENVRSSLLIVAGRLALWN